MSIAVRTSVAACSDFIMSMTDSIWFYVIGVLLLIGLGVLYFMVKNKGAGD